MFSLIPSDANDSQGLMRRKEPNKQTNSIKVFPCLAPRWVESMEDESNKQTTWLNKKQKNVT